MRSKERRLEVRDSNNTTMITFTATITTYLVLLLPDLSIHLGATLPRWRAFLPWSRDWDWLVPAAFSESSTGVRVDWGERELIGLMGSLSITPQPKAPTPRFPRWLIDDWGQVRDHESSPLGNLYGKDRLCGNGFTKLRRNIRSQN